MEAAGSSSSESLNIVKLPHHEEEPLCETRAKYRQGKKLTAVKVYTVADESRHLLLRNVTSVDVHDELAALCQRFGPLEQFGPVDGYETERFTRVYHVQYRRIAAARFAKSQLDDRNFFGTHLKACYAPELETLEETADKLRWRRLYYRNGLARLRGGQKHKPGSGRGAAAPAAPETTDPDQSADLTSPDGEPAAPLIGPCAPLPGEWAPAPGDSTGQDAPLPPLPPPPVAYDKPRKRIVFKRKRAEEQPPAEATGAASPGAAPGPFAQAELARTADRLRLVREQIQQAVLQSNEKRRRVDAQASDPA